MIVIVERGSYMESHFRRNKHFWNMRNPYNEAYNKEIIFRAWKGNEYLPENGMIFNMIENVLNIRCPISSKIIMEPETCSFFKCEYQFIGIRIENGEPKDYDSKARETKENKMG